MHETIFDYIHSGASPTGMPHDQFFVPPPPARPTEEQPGSAAKFRVLVGRVERGESLWHPDDQTCFDEGAMSDEL
jgi:hypothetical protein